MRNRILRIASVMFITAGLVIGIDLLLHGIWWIMFGLSLRRQSTHS